MDKKIAGLLGAAAALTITSGAGAQAAPAQHTELGPATSYGDLLKPVPNAVAVLREDEATRGQAEPARVELAQFYHHHHHHHGFFHHHHHHGFFGGGVVIGAPAVGPGGCWAWGRPYWNGFRWVRRRIWVCD